jgi:RNA polymerase sigma-70 factor, ECF subfamily
MLVARKQVQRRREQVMELSATHQATPALGLLWGQPAEEIREELEALFSRYRQRLYNTALHVVGNPQDAEDALQDGLLAAFCHLTSFKGRSQFSTWLTRIVINAALMRLRRRRPEGMTFSIDQPLDSDEQPLANMIPDPGPNPEEIYAWRERLQIFEQALQSLPVRYREPVRLYYVQGMSTGEAAEVLGLPIETLKSRLHRARLRLARRPTCPSLHHP